MIYNLKNIMESLLKIKAVTIDVKNPFIWTSGIKSPIYCDNRIIISYPEIRELISNSLANLVKEKYSDVEVIAGTATAGIPHATLVATILNLPMIYVREKTKNHGKIKKIEGILDKNKKVVVLEDLVSTGGSVLNVCNCIREEKSNILGIVSIFTYELEESKKLFRENNLELYSLINYNEFILFALNEGFITNQEKYLLEKWKNDPHNWLN